MMRDLNSGHNTFEAAVNSMWQVELPARNTLPKGNLVMIPLGGGVLEIVPEWQVMSFMDDLFDRHFGGFDASSRKHLILRSWLYGHTCECRHASSNTVTVPETLRRFVGSGELPLRIHVRDIKSCGDECVFDSYWVTPDEHGRVALPKRIVVFLGTAPIVFPSLMEDCIWAFANENDLSSFIDEVFNSKFGGFNPENRHHVSLKALLRGSSIATSVEDECALRLPPELVQRVALGRDVVIVGVGKHIEIYPAQRWAEICADVGGGTVFGIPSDRT